MKNYHLFYEQLVKPFRPYQAQLVVCNQLISGFIYLLYPLVLLWLFKEKSELVWGLLIYPAFGFVLVSLWRKTVNRPRPYETWEIEPLIAKETVGQSFPSRHVFSATVLGTVFLAVHPALGSLVLLLAVFLAFIRVIGGVHYPRDVIAGFFLGILFGLPVFFT